MLNKIYGTFALLLWNNGWAIRWAIFFVLFVSVGCDAKNSRAIPTVTPAVPTVVVATFSKDDAIAKARKAVETTFFLHGGETEKIQSVQVQNLSRGEAFLRIGQPFSGDADTRVWFVVVKAPFWSWSPPISNEGETGYEKAEYRGDEQYFIFDTMTGEEEGYLGNARFVRTVKFP